MNFDEPSHVTELRNRVVAFMDEHIYPNEATYFEQSMTLGPWAIWPIVEQLKPVARAAGLWNLFLPSKASKGEIVRQIERVVCLRELVDGIDLSVLPAARVRALARYGLMAKAGALRDLSDRRRRATLIASLVELRAEAADDLGDTSTCNWPNAVGKRNETQPLRRSARFHDWRLPLASLVRQSRSFLTACSMSPRATPRSEIVFRSVWPCSPYKPEAVKALLSAAPCASASSTTSAKDMSIPAQQPYSLAAESGSDCLCHFAWSKRIRFLRSLHAARESPRCQTPFRSQVGRIDSTDSGSTLAERAARGLTICRYAYWSRMSSEVTVR